jgi:hypothetical protein
MKKRRDRKAAAGNGPKTSSDLGPLVPGVKKSVVDIVDGLCLTMYNNQNGRGIVKSTDITPQFCPHAAQLDFPVTKFVYKELQKVISDDHMANWQRYL